MTTRSAASHAVRAWLAVDDVTDWQARGERLELALLRLVNALDASTGCDGVARLDAREALTGVKIELDAELNGS